MNRQLIRHKMTSLLVMLMLLISTSSFADGVVSFGPQETRMNGSIKYSVIGKYNALSLSAIRCIKTYLQMTNPRSSEQWQPLLTALNSIAIDTHLSHVLDLNLPSPAVKYTEELVPDDAMVKIDVNLLGNQMVVQKMIVEMMPNLSECLPELTALHQ